MASDTTNNGYGLKLPAGIFLLAIVGFGGGWYFQNSTADQNVPLVQLQSDVGEDAPKTIERETETQVAVVEPKISPEQEAPKIELKAPEPAPIPEVKESTVEEPIIPLRKPTFDYVRVENGTAIIAGRSEKGAVVDILGNGEKLNQAQVDGNGAFATFVTVPDSTEPTVLSMIAIKGDQKVASTDTYLVLPEKLGNAAMVVETDDDGIAVINTPLAQAPDVENTIVAALNEGATEPELPTVTTGEEEAQFRNLLSGLASDQPSGGATTPAVDDEQAIRLVAPQAVSDLTLDTINYGTEGEVILTGRGRVDQTVRVYVNNRPVTLGEIEGGQWRLTLPDVDEGIYTVRVDAVDAVGQVTARVESPFKRETPDLAARAGGAVTIQPGFTLWQLAEQSYGSGQRYVQIFEANKDSIRDPNLIYPGQVFDIPE